MTGMFMGTPGYLAPEVIEGKQSGPASDVHSWGATVAYAATGRPPFGTGSFETIFYRIVHGQPDLGSVPPPLLWMVARALARDPARRPAAHELCEWADALDPSSLVPGAAAAAGAVIAAAPGSRPAAPGTLADRHAPAALRGLPGSPGLPAAAAGGSVPRHDLTRPLAAAAPGAAAAAGAAGGDFHDLLPPVSYGRPAAQPEAQRGSQAGAAGQAAGRLPGGSRSAWSPLVISAMVVAVAAAVAFPLAGTAAALAALIALRAGDLTGRRLVRRRSRHTSRPGDWLVAAAYFPLALCRSAARFLLLAPLGLLGVGIVAAVTIIAVPAHPLPRAVSCGAGALIAFYAFGPGSGGCRKPLSRLFGTARSPVVTAALFIVAAAAALAAIVLAVSQPPFYWPAGHLSAQLGHQPALHSVISDIQRSLVRLARHFGF